MTYCPPITSTCPRCEVECVRYATETDRPDGVRFEAETEIVHNPQRCAQVQERDREDRIEMAMRGRENGSQF